MSDPSVELLVQELATLQGHCLIIADENWQGVAWSSVAFSGTADRQLVSNRYEIALAAEQAGVPTAFTDFDFSNLTPRQF